MFKQERCYNGGQMHDYVPVYDTKKSTKPLMAVGGNKESTYVRHVCTWCGATVERSGGRLIPFAAKAPGKLRGKSYRVIWEDEVDPGPPKPYSFMYERKAERLAGELSEARKQLSERETELDAANKLIKREQAAILKHVDEKEALRRELAKTEQDRLAAVALAKDLACGRRPAGFPPNSKELQGEIAELKNINESYARTLDEERLQATNLRCSNKALSEKFKQAEKRYEEAALRVLQLTQERDEARLGASILQDDAKRLQGYNEGLARETLKHFNRANKAGVKADRLCFTVRDALEALKHSSPFTPFIHFNGRTLKDTTEAENILKEALI